MSQDIFSKYPINQGGIEICVPAGVVGNLVVTSLRGNTFICPVKNGVVSVDEEAAELFLSGNNGSPLPGYAKSVLDANVGDSKPADNGSAPAAPGKILETIEEIQEFLKSKGVKFHPATGLDKLKALYAAELAKENSEKTVETLTADNYATVATEDLTKALVGVEDTDLLKSLIATESNGENRQDRIDALTVRLTELTA
jgi:hypothetical protein